MRKLLAMCLLLGGCSSLAKLTDGIDSLVTTAAALKTTIATADKDGDGTITWKELVAALGVLLGGGTAAAAALNAKTNKVDLKRSEKGTELWTTINELRDRLPPKIAS